MQIIKDAISPERLEVARKFFALEEAPSSEKKASDLDNKLRQIHDLETEIVEREAYARKQRVVTDAT